MADKPNVLENIIVHKRSELQHRKQALPIEVLKSRVTPSKRSLHDALSLPGNRYILEYKKASPSLGDIRPDLTVEQCVEAYEVSADAISVLTDERYFAGSHERLQRVSEQVKQPVLCKDFFIDTYQVFEARYFNADAILLMLSVLNDDEYRQLKTVADELALDVLTEVHSVEEAERAIALDAPIIGINNRDLTTLKTNLEVTERVAKLLPNDRIIISESGIDNRADVTRLAPLVDGFLIGTSLMKAPDIEQAAKQLVFGSVKICGVKTSKIARHCFEQGADYVGFMFYTPSSRYVEPVKARQIVAKVPGKYVGVFVDDEVDHIEELVNMCSLDVIQLHGKQTLQAAKQLKEKTAKPIWRAVTIRNEQDIAAIIEWLQVVDKVLLDYQSEQTLGGSGRSFDWRLLEGVFAQIDPNKIIVAGGVNAENLSVLHQLDVTAVDLSSSVESAPGKKDKALITEFFNRCRFNGRHNEGN